MPLESLHLALQQRHVAPVPPIADNHDHGPVGHQAGRELAVEGAKRTADVRPSGPTQNRVGNPFQRAGDLFGPDQMSDAAQRRAEDKSLHAPELVLQAVHELDQKAAVAVHRATDIAEQHHAGLLDSALAADELDDVAAVFDVLPHGPAGVHFLALGRPLFAPADLRGDFRGDEQDRAADGAALFDCHVAEIFFAEGLARAIGGKGNLLRFAVPAGVAAGERRQKLFQALAAPS